MNLLEYYSTIINTLPKLILLSEDNAAFADRPNYVRDLATLRLNVHLLENIPVIQDAVQRVYSSWLFEDAKDTKFISNNEKSQLNAALGLLSLKLSVLISLIESSELFGKENVLYIKLPELNTFDELAKASTEFKKAIEIPIADESINGEIKILAGDQGSVILYVSLGTILAIKLVAAICWAAYVLKRKRAEAKIFEQHAKTLELKNDALQSLVEAQKQQLKNILQSEAEAIASKHYSHSEPETIERLKLSITSVADLVERGAKILPMNNNEEIQKLFPDNSMGLIESSIKQIGGGA